MIRTFTACLLFAATIGVAAGQQQTKTTPAPASRGIPVITIPKDAVANDDGTFSYTDKDGKHWLYTNTPFGVQKAPAAGAVKASNAKLPAGLPKGAVRNAEGRYAWTDPAGKKWIYSETPFGLSREPANPLADWKVTDKGDMVRFEHPGPFGPTAWEKKKTELTDEERSAYELHHATSQQARPE